MRLVRSGEAPIKEVRSAFSQHVSFKLDFALARCHLPWGQEGDAHPIPVVAEDSNALKGARLRQLNINRPVISVNM